MKIPLQRLRKEAGFKSARVVAEMLGVPVPTYTDWEQGRRLPALDVLWQIADALGEAMGRHVSLDELAGRPWPTQGLTPEERALVDAYRASDERGQGNIMDTAGREKRASAGDMVPVVEGVG